MTNNALVVGLFALSALVISLSSVYFIVNFYESENSLSNQEKIFYSANLDKDEKKVFIIGSSQVWRVNMTMINEEAHSFCDCVVYNLGISADQPFKRIKTIHEIISLEPDLVIYGLGYRDFAIPEGGEPIIHVEKPNSILPDPQNYFQTEFFFNEIINPKFFTFNEISNLLHSKKREEVNVETTSVENPNSSDILFKTNEFEERHYMSYNNTELEKIGSDTVSRFVLDSNYIQVNSKAVEKISDEFKKNNIKMVIMKTPHSKNFIDGISKKDQEIYNSTIDKISKNSNIKIYDLNEKFMNMAIWSDPWHVTLGKEGEIYSEEFIKIIQQEMK